jgi:hypothetical protein
VVDHHGVPIEIEDSDPTIWAGYPRHLGERPFGIGGLQVHQESFGATHVERPVREGKCLHFPYLKGDGYVESLGALSGLSDHNLTRVESNETASWTDKFHHVKHIDPGTAAKVEDCVSRRQSDPLQHESLARLNRWDLVYLIHEPNEEVRILGTVDLREKAGMGTSAHADYPTPYKTKR